MTSFKRTQRKYVQKAYRVRNWREYETGLRARGSLTVWLGLTDGKLANWSCRIKPTMRCFLLSAATESRTDLRCSTFMNARLPGYRPAAVSPCLT